MRAEGERAEDAVAQRLLLLVPSGRPSTSTASTIALSALSRPSSATSSAMVRKSDGMNHELQASLGSSIRIEVDTTRINAYTWIGATLSGRSGREPRARPLLHQRGGADARHASADAAQVRAARAGAADAARSAACGSTRATSSSGCALIKRLVDDGGHQPGGRAAAAVDRRGRPADPPARCATRR